MFNLDTNQILMLGIVLGFVGAIVTKGFNVIKNVFITEIRLLDTDSSYYRALEIMTNEGLIDKARMLKVYNGPWYMGIKSKNSLTIDGRQIYKLWNRYVRISFYDNDILKVQGISISFLKRNDGFKDRIIEELLNKNSLGEMTNFSKINADGVVTTLPSKLSRSLDSVYLDERNRKELMLALKTFNNNKNKGIKNNLNILLYGPPGTGKTSLIRGIADYLNKDILVAIKPEDYVAGLERAPDSIIVCEEVDTFKLGNRDAEDNNCISPIDYLGVMLQAMDGLLSPDSSISIFTTNHKEKLDKAFLRDGRITLELYMNKPDKEIIINAISDLMDFPISIVRDLISDKELSDNVTVATVELICKKHKSLNIVIDELVKYV